MRRCASQDVRVSNGHDDDKDSHRRRARSLKLALAPAGLQHFTFIQRTDDALAALGVKSSRVQIT